ncbi:MAG: hypothetical protein PHH85_02215 [Candidatus Methanoperedens sp.]|nr:hypothetical protein [Candidatus Methanoperedens sp.]
MNSGAFIIMDKESQIIRTIKDETFDALQQELLKYQGLAEKSQNMYLNTPWYKVFRLFKLKLAVKVFTRQTTLISAEIDLLNSGVIL